MKCEIGHEKVLSKGDAGYEKRRVPRVLARVKKIHLYSREAICWVLVRVSNRHVTSQTHESTHLTTTR